MKKILSIALVACMLLAGCGKTDNTKQTSDVAQGDEPITLSVLTGNNRQQNITELYDRAFRAKHPDVTINYITRNIDEDANVFADRMAAETMAGKGPDVCLMSTYQAGYFDNIYKTMQAGAFEDISSFLAADQSFKKDDYLPTAMEACAIDGKQYAMPIGISTSFYISTQRILEEMSFDVDKANTIFGVTDQLGDYYKQRKPDDARRMVGPYCTYLPSYTNYVDIVSKTVRIDTPEMAGFCETMKSIDREVWHGNYSTNENAEALSSDSVGILQWNMGLTLLDTLAQLPPEEVPVLFPTYNDSGEVQAVVTDYCAISAVSAHKQMAYDYMVIASKYYDVTDSQYASADTPLDMKTPYITQEFIPTYKSAYDYHLDTYLRMNEQGHVLSTVGEGQKNGKVNPLDPAIVNAFKTLYDDIDVCTLYSDGNAKLLEYLKPYFNDEAQLADCLKTAQSAMEIYITE